MPKTTALAAILLLCGSPALALEGGSPANTSAKAKDPNRVICEKQEVLGSRLASKRVCMTAAQWAEQRQLQRQDIDRSQMQSRAPTAN